MVLMLNVLIVRLSHVAINMTVGGPPSPRSVLVSRRFEVLGTETLRNMILM